MSGKKIFPHDMPPDHGDRPPTGWTEEAALFSRAPLVSDALVGVMLALGSGMLVGAVIVASMAWFSLGSCQ